MGSWYELLLGYKFFEVWTWRGCMWGIISHIGDFLGVCFWCGGDLDCEVNDTHL